MSNFRAGENAIDTIDKYFQRKSQKGYGSYYPIYQYPSKWNWRDVRGWDWTSPIRGQIGDTCRYLACYDVMESCLRIWSRIYRDSKDVRIDEKTANPQFGSINTTNEDGSGGLIDVASAIQYKGLPIIGIDDSILKEHLIDHGLLKSSFTYSSAGNYVLVPKNYHFIESKDESVVKEWIHRYGPVVTSIRLTGYFSDYEEGIIPSRLSDDPKHIFTEPIHAVSIFGYDDSEKYWICKNTYGTSWGEDGWFKIAYSSKEKNGFAEVGFLTFVPPRGCWAPDMMFRTIDILIEKP